MLEQNLLNPIDLLTEDALCIFAGTILPIIETGKSRRLLLALYLGVVLSDIITFSIGKLLRNGVLEPIRRRMNLKVERVVFCEDGNNNVQNDDMEDEGLCTIETPELRKMDRILAKLESAGDYVGFVIRFSFGVRAPMMILAGFSGKVPFLKYAAGTVLGAACSLALQLLVGYAMRNNPTAIVAAIATISSIVLFVPFAIAISSWASLMWKRYQFNKLA